MGATETNKGIALALQQCGDSQTELGKRLGLSQAMISRYLHGVFPVPVFLALHLEREFDVPRHLTRPDEWKETKRAR